MKKNPKIQTLNTKQDIRIKFQALILGTWNLFRVSILGLSVCLLLVNIGYTLGQAGLDIAVLKAGVGARPLGMGGAFTAIADNADAPFWNPAGLARIKQQEIDTMQTRLSTDADHYYISYVRPLGKGTIGFSWIQVGAGTLTRTTTTDAFNEVITTGIFSYFSNAYLLSYGLPLNPNISFGMTAKYLTSDMYQISGGQAYGYSVTPGIMLNLNNSKFTIGAKIDELLNEQSWGTGTVEKVPPKARLGVALKEPRGLPLGSTVALDLAQLLKSNYATEVSAGYEWSRDGLAIRTGYTESALTAGAGFQSGVAQIDYAYVQQMSLSRENVHRISLSGKW